MTSARSKGRGFVAPTVSRSALSASRGKSSRFTPWALRDSFSPASRFTSSIALRQASAFSRSGRQSWATPKALARAAKRGTVSKVRLKRHTAGRSSALHSPWGRL